MMVDAKGIGARRIIAQSLIMAVFLALTWHALYEGAKRPSRGSNAYTVLINSIDTAMNLCCNSNHASKAAMQCLLVKQGQ